MAVRGTLAQVQQWASGYLSYIGAPQSQGNIEGLSAQVYQEGDFGTSYGGGSTNPLNIENGSGGFLQPASTQAGYAATASFMQRNDPGFISALKSNKGASPQPYINALSAGQWEALNSGPDAYLNPQYGSDVASTLSEIYKGKYQAPTPAPSSSGNAGKKPTTTSTTTTADSWDPFSSITSSSPAPTIGPTWLPWNWGSDAVNSVWRSAVPYVVIVLGLIVVIWGLKIAFEGGGAGAPSGGGGVMVNVEHDAEHAGEAAAA